MQRPCSNTRQNNNCRLSALHERKRVCALEKLAAINIAALQLPTIQKKEQQQQTIVSQYQQEFHLIKLPLETTQEFTGPYHSVIDILYRHICLITLDNSCSGLNTTLYLMHFDLHHTHSTLYQSASHMFCCHMF